MKKKTRTEKGVLLLYPAFPLCFMTNKMFFQRLNIMRHDVSGSSSQTLGVNVPYPKMSCFHKPFPLLYFFSQTRLLHSGLANVHHATVHYVKSPFLSFYTKFLPRFRIFFRPLGKKNPKCDFSLLPNHASPIRHRKLKIS